LTKVQFGNDLSLHWTGEQGAVDSLHQNEPQERFAPYAAACSNYKICLKCHEIT
jgi:hypothetical protein